MRNKAHRCLRANCTTGVVLSAPTPRRFECFCRKRLVATPSPCQVRQDWLSRRERSCNIKPRWPSTGCTMLRSPGKKVKPELSNLACKSLWPSSWRHLAPAPGPRNRPAHSLSVAFSRGLYWCKRHGLQLLGCCVEGAKVPRLEGNLCPILVSLDTPKHAGVSALQL